MQAGQLRHQVILQTRSTAQDSFGAQVFTWTDLATIFAAVVPVSGREQFVGGGEQTDTSHQVLVRYRPEFADPKAVAAMRILHGSRVLNITGMANENERNRMVTLYANEGLNNG